jgi:hypothetical protein
MQLKKKNKKYEKLEELQEFKLFIIYFHSNIHHLRYNNIFSQSCFR